MSNLKKSVSLITLSTGLATILSLVSSLVVAAKFGAGISMDAYIAAITLPSFLVTIITLSLSSTFLPVFTDYRVQKPGEAWRLAWGMFNVLVPGAFLICVVGILFASPLMNLLCPGFSASDVEHAARLLRILLPMAFLNVINELVASLYYAHKRFALPILFKSVGPLLTIAMVLAFADRLSITSMALAGLFAAALQVIFSLGGISRLPGFRYYPPSLVFHPGTIRILRLTLPLLASMLVYKALPFFDRWVGSSLPIGSLSVLGYAAKLTSLIQPLLISGIALSFYPLMAEFASRNDYKGLQNSMGRSMRMILFVSTPVALFLGLFSRPVVEALLARGQFSLEAATQTYKVFAVCLLAIPGMLVGSITGQGFYVLKDTKTVTWLGLTEVALYIPLCLALVPWMGIYAIPASQAVYFTLSLIASLWLLSRRMGLNLFSELSSFAGRQILSMGGGLAVSLPLLVWLPVSLYSALMEMAIGLVVYFLSARFVFKVREAGVFTAHTHNMLFRREAYRPPLDLPL